MKDTLSSSFVYSYIDTFNRLIAKIKSEIWLLALMITIGMLGCIYLIESCKSQFAYNQTLYLDQNSNSPTSEISAAQALTVKGDFTAQSPIVFKFPQKNRYSKLMIDYGNGHIDQVTKGSALYQYHRSGVYQVKLLHVDQLKTTTIATTTIEIEDNKILF